MFANHGDSRVTVGGHTRRASDKRITMYLFSPQEQPDMYVRPNHYTFDMEFMNDVEKIVDKSAYEYESSYGGNYVNQIANQSVAINRAIKPSAKGIEFRGSHFEGLWTFLLIIDNAPALGRHTRRNQSNRLMYIGFIMDGEPCSQLMGRITLNPNALLVATHKTHLNIKETASAAGGFNIIVPQLDEDIVSPGIVQMQTPDRNFVLSPSALVSSFSRDGDGTEINSPGMAYISNNDSHLRFDTDTKSPMKQMRTLLNGLTKMKIYDKGDDSFRPDFRRNSTGLRDYNTKREIFAQSLTHSLPDVTVGIPLNKPIDMNMLINEYPSIVNNVEVIKLPFSIPAEMNSSAAPTPTNIWTSLLQSTLPSIFAYYGVCDMAFRYCSWDAGSITRLDNQPVWEVQDIATFIPTTSEDIKVKWEYILSAMEQQVFSLIHSNCGEFDVTVHFTANNYCSIQLQLMDIDEVPNNGFIVSHGAASPFATPLIGRESDRMQNATALEDLIAYSDYSNTVPLSY